MKQLILFLLFPLFSTVAFAQKNPFIKHMYTADPSARVWSDGRLYVYASHDIAPPRGCDLMDQYHVFSTNDMINWVDHGEILRADQVPWAEPLRNDGKFMWAPDCAYKNGKYYFYFPKPDKDPWNSNWKIGVAVSDKPASGFKSLDHPVLGLPDKGEIDPCVFVDTDGKVYFYYGGGGKCYGARMKDNMYEIDGELIPMEGLYDFHEAAWVHKRNGFYYLSYSDNHDNRNDKEGVIGNNRMRYAMSKSPLGPWVHKGVYMNPTDSYTNHGSIVEFKGKWYAFYHNSELSAANGEHNDWLRSVCWDELHYNEDGTIQMVIQTDNIFRAGSSKINISPTSLSENRTLLDSLYARSLILQFQNVRIAFLSLDLGNYNNPELMKKLKKEFKLNEIYFCPSHTHSGATDRNTIEAKIRSIIKEASENMFSAKISAGNREIPQLAFNRLIVRGDGHAREAWYADQEGHFRYLNKERIPFGPIDSSVGVIRIDDTRGNPRAVIMNYACHPDALVAVRSVVSAEYVGHAAKYVENAFDNRINCLFIQGGAGNQCPLFKTPTNGETPEAYFDMVQRMGTLLGIETAAFAKELFPNPNDKFDLRLRTDSIDMPNRFDKDIANVHFSTILINDRIAIATFPGEPFIKFQLDWKREMGGISTPFFFGYTWNGGQWPTYVPDVRSAALGGYGADWGPVRAPGTGEALMTKHLNNYYIIKGLMRSTQGPGDHRLDDGSVIWMPDWQK